MNLKPYKTNELIDWSDSLTTQIRNLSNLLEQSLKERNEIDTEIHRRLRGE